MFTTRFEQTGNSCAAATLMIALHEFELEKKKKTKKHHVDADTEWRLYEQTRDPVMSQKLNVVDENDYYSTPVNIIKTAEKEGLKAKLYELKDVKVPKQVKELKQEYVDPLNPKRVRTADLKALLKTGKLQLLVYLDGDWTKQHWVLLRQEGHDCYLYDTAYGRHQKAEADEVLAFDAGFSTGRRNNFSGIAIHLLQR